MERSMSKPVDLSKSLAALDQDSTLIVVIELSRSDWLVAARAPGVARDPLKKLKPEPEQLFKLIDRWREESRRAGGVVRRVCVAFEAGRDGFWLARLLRQHDIEAYVIHPTSIPVKRDHRRAKTDRLDTALLMRAFLGWLRGEADHCSMAAIPTLEEEDGKRPTREHESRVKTRSSIVNRLKGALARLGIHDFNPKLRKAAEKLEQLRTGAGEPLPPNTLAELRRDMAALRFVADQIKQIEKARETRLERAPREGTHPMVLMLASIKGIGLETAEMLVAEILSRKLRDRRAVARYGGLTGSPDESGSKRREKGLARAGNGRVRRGMIQLAWRFLMFQKNSALTKWFQTRTVDGPRGVRKTMIVAMARKLLIDLWRFVEDGVVPAGVVLFDPAG
jgi:transposase